MIIVHMGQPKTGTTVLQHALLQLSKTSQRFVYPAEFRDKGAGHHNLAIALQDASRAAEAARSVRLLVERQPESDLVLSSEAFSNLLRARYFANLRQFLRVCGEASETLVVLYLRRYDDFVNSMFLQSARQGRLTMDPDDYADNSLAAVEAWFQGVGLLRDLEGVGTRIAAYRPDLDVLTHFESISGSLMGLSKMKSLPQTQKYTLKEQVFTAFAAQLMGYEPSRRKLNRFLNRLRKLGARIPGDTADYCVIEPKRDRALRAAALAEAEKYRVTAYVDAFRHDLAVKKNHVPYGIEVLSENDIAYFQGVMES